jgi:large subunit ribosomal protein L2
LLKHLTKYPKIPVDFFHVILLIFYLYNHFLVKASEGDAYPVGALPIGTIVNCVEGYPGQGAHYAMNAGTFATIMKRIDNRCILQLPTKHEISILEQCMVTVGRLSNVEHNEFIYGKAGAKRLMGIRPKLGLFHPKTGRFGRRPFRPKPILVITGEKPEYPNVIKLQHPELDPLR